MFNRFIVILLIGSIANAEITKFSDAKVKDIDGNDVSFKKFENKCALVIDTASADREGSIDIVRTNMEYLNELKQKYPKLEILAFPSTSFGKEDKTNEELKKWFTEEWHLDINVFALSDFNESELNKFLNKQSYFGRIQNRNFYKYVVFKDGLFVRKYHQYSGAVSESLIDTMVKRCLSS